VEESVHVEGIIETGVENCVCSDGLGIAKKLGPGLPLDYEMMKVASQETFREFCTQTLPSLAYFRVARDPSTTV
jgi:hypothetical protein